MQKEKKVQKPLFLLVGAEDNDDFNIYCTHFIMRLDKQSVTELDVMMQSCSLVFDRLPDKTTSIDTDTDHWCDGWFIKVDEDDEETSEMFPPLNDGEFRIVEDNLTSSQDTHYYSFHVHKGGVFYALSDSSEPPVRCSHGIDWGKVKEAYYGFGKEEGTSKD